LSMPSGENIEFSVLNIKLTPFIVSVIIFDFMEHYN